MQNRINDTSAYHRGALTSLGWELTVCNTIENASSPARSILQHNSPYGEQLLSFLSRQIDLTDIGSVGEVGGGYGFLMRSLLRRFPHWKVLMLDISPFLLARQRETLASYNVRYVEGDFLRYHGDDDNKPNLMIFNENLGDFPTLVGLAPNVEEGPASVAAPLVEAQRLLHDYHLPLSCGDNFNLGAILAVEKVCALSVPYIFIAEHSCEATVPQEYSRYVEIHAEGNPHRIALYGHDEYTIKFSHLCTVAEAFGYTVRRGALAEILPFVFDDALRAQLSQPPQNASVEIIQHFFSDLFQYEYLLLAKPKSGNQR